MNFKLLSQDGKARVGVSVPQRSRCPSRRAFQPVDHYPECCQLASTPVYKATGVGGCPLRAIRVEARRPKRVVSFGAKAPAARRNGRFGDLHPLRLATAVQKNHVVAWRFDAVLLSVRRQVAIVREPAAVDEERSLGGADRQMQAVVVPVA